MAKATTLKRFMQPSALKLFFLISIGCLFFCPHSFATSFIYSNSANPENKIINKTDYLKASVFVKLSSKEFAALSGTKLNFLQKLYFKSVQRKLARELKNNPDLLISQYYDQKKAKFKLDALWFVLGCILGPLAILFSFTSKQPKVKRTSAVLGFIIFIIWFGFLTIF